jgi:hypothetical protein
MSESSVEFPLTPEEHCLKADCEGLVVPRIVHEASKFLMNLHGVKPGTLALSELLKLRPELANLKWDIKTRRIDPSKEFEWLLTDWEFRRKRKGLSLDEVKSMRKQVEDSQEMYYNVSVFKRVFEILAGCIEKVSLDPIDMDPCDTQNHIDIGLELVNFLILPSPLIGDLKYTAEKCALSEGSMMIFIDGVWKSI